MDTKKLLAIITFISMVLTNNFLFARPLKGDTTNISIVEQNNNPIFIRASAGIGRSSISFGGIAFLTVGLGNLYSSLRYCVANELLSGDKGGPDIHELGLLVGLSYNFSIGYISVGTGISRVTDYRGYYLKPPSSAAPNEFYPFVETSHSVVGLPVQVDLFYTPLDFLGIGFSYFLNVNNVYSISGYMVCIQIGKLH